MTYRTSMIWNPQGPDGEIVGIAITLNEVQSTEAFGTFRAYLHEITDNNAWPDVDLFNVEGVLDEEQ